MSKNCRMILVVAVVGLFVAGCGSGSNPGNTTRMTLTTQYIAGGIRLTDPNAAVQGATLDPPFPGDQINTKSSFIGTTDSTGVLIELGVILPASWGFQRFATPNCNRFDTYAAPGLGNPATPFLICGETSVFLFVAPTTVDFLNPPGTLTISNNQNLFSVIYGMPTVSIFDETGTLMSDASANWVSVDGNSLTVPLSLGLNMFTGTYAIVVRNVQAGGAQTIAGGASVNVINNDPPPPPPPPPDPCGGQPCLIIP
jgi:hypothetical protein